jgi:hypothetical protein
MDVKKKLRDAIPILKSSKVDDRELARYMRGRKLITANVLENIQKGDQTDSIEVLIDSLTRKGNRAWVALKDWLVRNVSSDVYHQITDEQAPLQRRKLLPEFNLVAADIDDSLPLVDVGDIKDPKASPTQPEPDICEDTLTDPWGDATDSELNQMLIQAESQSIEFANEAGLYELWSEIISDNLSMGDVSNNRMRCKLNLGKSIFVTAGLWKGRMQIHVRRYDPSNNFATEKGVVFTLDLWKKFSNLAKVIDDHFEKIQKLSGSDIILEVGNRVFVEMEMTSPKIDLRLWWYPPGKSTLRRTTKGVKLGVWQWDKLKAVFQYLPAFVPELNE